MRERAPARRHLGDEGEAGLQAVHSSGGGEEGRTRRSKRRALNRCGQQIAHRRWRLLLLLALCVACCVLLVTLERASPGMLNLLRFRESSHLLSKWRINDPARGVVLRPANQQLLFRSEAEQQDRLWLEAQLAEGKALAPVTVVTWEWATGKHWAGWGTNIGAHSSREDIARARWCVARHDCTCELLTCCVL